METLIFILAIMFWVLLALSCFCLCSICYIKLTYLKWDKEEREKQQLIMFLNNQKDIRGDNAA